MTTRCANVQLKLSKTNQKDHQVRIVTGVCPLSKDGESVIAEYGGTHTPKLSCCTHPIIGLTPYSVPHNSQLRHMQPIFPYPCSDPDAGTVLKVLHIIIQPIQPGLSPGPGPSPSSGPSLQPG